MSSPSNSRPSLSSPAPRTPTPATRPTRATRPTLVLYSRRECHLCDVAKDEIEELRRRFAFDVEVRDVDQEPGWAEAYGDEVPVGFVGERKVFKYRVDGDKLQRALLSDR